jgi:predicted deacylase
MNRLYRIAFGVILLNAVLFAILWFIITPATETLPTPTPTDTPTAAEPEPVYQRYEVIGSSVEGRSLESYSFGSGATRLLFVGGVHGGYEWNSILLAYEAIDYLALHPELLPNDITVTIIPNLNPDGTFAALGTTGRFTATEVPADTGVVTGLGRFNANEVDLNRNFDCTWRSKLVSAGTAAFSEPEAAALRDFVIAHTPKAAVFWHSQANAVYGSACEAGILPTTTKLLNTYATAANYQAIPIFDAYPVTGDAESWLATLGIPAITVELATHESVEWEQNRAGMMAVINAYSSESQ